MLKKLVMAFCLVLVFGCVATEVPSPVQAATKKYQLGDTTIILRITQYGSGPRFIALHSNETTSVVAAKALRVGTVLELTHSGGRNVSFGLGGKRYTFDPNRIFSATGIKKTLSQNGPYSKEAQKEVKKFSDWILIFLHAANTRQVVALHNNTEGHYSVSSYLKGGSEAAAAAKVFVNPKNDPDDFFLTTDGSVFTAMSKQGFNVVLQSRRPPDDGSLSVYCALNCRSYVNVEAQAGHSAIQKKMISALLR